MHRLREQLGLTQPLYVQFLLYLRNLLGGDLGFSVINRKPVLDLILERTPATVVLMSAAFVFSVIVGVISAVKARTLIDYVVTMVSLFGYSMPTFWLGLILILVFALHLGWFPTMRMVTLGRELSGLSGLADVLHHLVLPSITLGTFYLATYARLTRSSMLDDFRLAGDGRAHLPGDPPARLCAAHGPVFDRVRLCDSHESGHRPSLYHR